MLLFESFNEIEAICREYNLKNYTINPDGTIDVDGDVKFFPGSIKAKSGLVKLPLEFGEVSGSFLCYDNDLTTLKGAPKSVGDIFNCSENKLTTLKGAPKYVGGYFSCYENKLTTLEGAPQSVSSDFDCTVNKLTTLEGAPKSVGGDFYCYGNPLDSVKTFFPDDKTFHKLCMEWQFFAGGNKIWKHKFLEAMLDIDKELPKSIPGYEYI